MKFRIYLFIKIETYWNVNTLATTENYLALDIKIETYWNVNKIVGNNIDLSQQFK